MYNIQLLVFNWNSHGKAQVPNHHLVETEYAHSPEDVIPVYLQGLCQCRMGKFRMPLTINNTCQEKHGVLYTSKLQSVSSCRE